MVGRSTIGSFSFDSLVKVKSLLPDITAAAIDVKNLRPRLWELSGEAVAEAHRRGYVGITPARQRMQRYSTGVLQTTFPGTSHSVWNDPGLSSLSYV